ncbi:hypothetical protein CsSME_00002260 [Camellia sinensis var. sinensis]
MNFQEDCGSLILFSSLAQLGHLFFMDGGTSYACIVSARNSSWQQQLVLLFGETPKCMDTVHH